MKLAIFISDLIEFTKTLRAAYNIIKTISSNEYLHTEKTEILKELENIRLEVLLQLMYEQIENASLETIDVYKEGKPNINHILIAKLSKQRKISHVLTTNFDTLIEKACIHARASSIPKDYIFQKY